MTQKYLLPFLIFTVCLLTQLYGKVEMPQEVIDVMASREMRHHHYLWHQVRNLWDRFDNNTKAELTRLGWEPPRPSQRYVRGSTIVLEDNGSGEDFLYMHRKMIETANNITADFKVVGWKYIPPPTSTKSPLPPVYNHTTKSLTDLITLHKSNDFYYNSIMVRDRRYKDPEYLRTVTLGQLGSRIEFSIHSWLHTRFSSNCSVGYRRRLTSDPLPDVDEKWDVPAYDWLVDTYASQANPYFWKLHGWVDDRIQDWMDANNVKELIWNNTWVGGPMTEVVGVIEAGKDVKVRNLMEGMEGMESEVNEGETVINVMDEVTKILMKTGLEWSFTDKIVLGEDEEDLVPKISKCKRRRL